MEQNLNNDKAYIEHGHLEHRHSSEKKDSYAPGTKLWVAIGAVVLIILLILWLTIADLWGDTDVAAQLVNVASVHTTDIAHSLL